MATITCYTTSTITASVPTIRRTSGPYYHLDAVGTDLRETEPVADSSFSAAAESHGHSDATAKKMAYKMAYINEKRALRRVNTGYLAETEGFEP